MNFLVELYKNMLNMTLISSILILLIIVIRTIFRRKLTSKTYYMLWLIVLIRLIFPFSIESSVSVENVIFSGETKPSQSYEAVSVSPVKETQPSELITAEYGERSFQSGTLFIERIQNSRKIYQYGAILWLFGIFAVILIPIVSYSVLRKDLMTATKVDDTDTIKASVHIRSMLDIAVPIDIVYSNVCIKPALIGIFKPMIVLLEKTRGLGYEKIYAILLHELVHYKKKHLLIQWLFWIVKSVYWFNPFIWLAHRIMKQDAECWCDEEVLKLMNEDQRVLYGNLVLDMAVYTEDPVVAFNVTGFGNKSSEIKKRIIGIAKKTKQSKPMAMISIALLIILIPIFFTVRTNNVRVKPIEKHIEQTLFLDEKQSSDDMLVIRPVKYAYNTKSQLLTVYIDYKVSEQISALAIEKENVSLFMAITFPGSISPEVRNKTVRGEPIKDSSGIIAGFDFHIKGYEKSQYGTAKLSFEGAQIDLPIEMENKNRSHEITKDNLPYSVVFDDIVTYTFSRMSVDTKSNTISVIIEGESLLGMEAQPFIIYRINKNGMKTKSLSGIGHISKANNHSGISTPRIRISEDRMFYTSLDEDEKLYVDFKSLTLFIDRHVAGLQLADEVSWRFSIDVEELE